VSARVHVDFALSMVVGFTSASAARSSYSVAILETAPNSGLGGVAVRAHSRDETLCERPIVKSMSAPRRSAGRVDNAAKSSVPFRHVRHGFREPCAAQERAPC